jgi:hypothetical protein
MVMSGVVSFFSAVSTVSKMQFGNRLFSARISITDYTVTKCNILFLDGSGWHMKSSVFYAEKFCASLGLQNKMNCYVIRLINKMFISTEVLHIMCYRWFLCDLTPSHAYSWVGNQSTVVILKIYLSLHNNHKIIFVLFHRKKPHTIMAICNGL